MIKCNRHTPPPVPQPPDTFSLEGLTKTQMERMLHLIKVGQAQHRASGGSRSFDDFERRLIAVITAKLGPST